jgi:DNA polymerase-1
MYRAYHAIPKENSALIGLRAKLKQLNHDRIIACFDSKRSKNIRCLSYPEYKANRPTCPSDLCEQFEKAFELLKEENIEIVKVDGYEADDLIFSICRDMENDSDVESVQIVSLDKDLLQILMYRKSFMQYGKYPVYYDDVFLKYDVYPEQFALYLALVGDAVDNIPGIFGIGPKRAASLIHKKTFDEIHELYPEVVTYLDLTQLKYIPSVIVS